MGKKSATQLREEAKKLMVKAREAEQKSFLKAGKLAKRFYAGKLPLEKFQLELEKIF